MFSLALAAIAGPLGVALGLSMGPGKYEHTAAAQSVEQNDASAYSLIDSPAEVTAQPVDPIKRRHPAPSLLALGKSSASPAVSRNEATYSPPNPAWQPRLYPTFDSIDDMKPLEDDLDALSPPLSPNPTCSSASTSPSSLFDSNPQPAATVTPALSLAGQLKWDVIDDYLEQGWTAGVWATVEEYERVEQFGRDLVLGEERYELEREAAHRRTHRQRVSPLLSQWTVPRKRASREDRTSLSETERLESRILARLNDYFVDSILGDSTPAPVPAPRRHEQLTSRSVIPPPTRSRFVSLRKVHKAIGHQLPVPLRAKVLAKDPRRKYPNDWEWTEECREFTPGKWLAYCAADLAFASTCEAEEAAFCRR